MDIHKVFTPIELERYYYYRDYHGRIYSFLKAKICFRKVYFSYLEIPLTTYCTLCCKHCANLIQYYSNPMHSSAEQVISSLTTILSGVDGIGLLRLLGGEPLLYPELYQVLCFCLKQPKIKRIEIVTNGTLLFPENILALLSKAKTDIKICISSYGKNSSRKDMLKQQLNEAGITYKVVLSKWRAAGNILRRDRNMDAIKELFLKCAKYRSLLNGELHVCARSSHGTDLHLVPKKKGEYIVISEYKNDTKALRNAICKFLNRQYIEACNYCDGDELLTANAVVPGEQCSREECLAYFHEVQQQNPSAE